MKAQRELEKRIKQKEEELIAKEREIIQVKAYLEAMRDSLKLINKSAGGDGRETLRPGSMVDKARIAIREAGRPLHVEKILESVGKEATKENKISLSGSLASYVRQNIIFTRTAPNTFGLLEFQENLQDDLPEGFGRE